MSMTETLMAGGNCHSNPACACCCSLAGLAEAACRTCAQHGCCDSQGDSTGCACCDETLAGLIELMEKHLMCLKSNLAEQTAKTKAVASKKRAP